MSLNQVQQISSVLEQAKRVLVIFKNDPVCDGAAAGCALAQALAKAGKEVEVVSSGWQHRPELKFLPGVKNIQSQLTQSKKLVISVDLAESAVGGLSYEIKDNQLLIYLTPQGQPLTPKEVKAGSGRWPQDLIFVLDCQDLSSLGGFYQTHQDLFSKAPVINIDHHPANENFGQINLVDLKAAAVCEVIFDLLAFLGKEQIDDDCATALLCGIIAKTKSFRSAHLSAATLAKASELVELGARRKEIVEHLFAGRSIDALKLWGLALSRLKSAERGLVWLSVRAEDFLESNTTEAELPAMIDHLLSQSPAAKVVTLFYESSNASSHAINVLVHTHDHYDARILTRGFNATGSKNLARFSLSNQTLATAENQVISSIKKILEAVY